VLFGHRLLIDPGCNVIILAEDVPLKFDLPRLSDLLTFFKDKAACWNSEASLANVSLKENLSDGIYVYR
jgi:hypothetical protein